MLGDFAAYPLRGADGNRALGDDQLGAVQVPPDGARHLEHVLQVGRAVLARWRADRDEDDVRTLDRSADVGGELQAAVPLIAHDERLESGLVDREPVLRSEEHTSELQSRSDLVCRLLLEKKKNTTTRR